LLLVRRFEAGSIHFFSTVRFCPSPDIAVHLLCKELFYFLYFSIATAKTSPNIPTI